MITICTILSSWLQNLIIIESIYNKILKYSVYLSRIESDATCHALLTASSPCIDLFPLSMPGMHAAIVYEVIALSVGM